MVFIWRIGGCGLIKFLKWLDEMSIRKLRLITYSGMIVISFTAWYYIIKLIKYLYKLIIGE